MALIELPAPQVLFPWNWNIAGYPSGTEATFVFDAVNDEFVMVFQCPPDAFTLDKVSFYISAATIPPSAGNLAVSVYAISTTTGELTGGALASVNVDATTITVAGRYVATGLAYALTAGALYGISIKADASYSGSITQRTGSASAALSFPYGLTSNAGSSYARAQGRAGGFYIGLGTSTEYKKIVGLVGALFGVDVSRNINDATPPDEIGNIFTFAQPMRVIGAVWYFSTGSGNVTLNLRDNAGAVQKTIEIDSSQQNDSSTMGLIFLFPTAFDTAANVPFELTAAKSGFAGTLVAQYLEAADNAELDALWNASICGVTYNNGGSRATETARMYGIFPIVSHIGDDSGGSGSGIGALVGGSLAGR